MPGALGVRGPAPGALVFLRGRDADARLRELGAQRARIRPLLGALAIAFVGARRFEQLGFRCLSDWSRERIGVGARTVREWARVWRALAALPRLRAAVCAGEVSWAVARKVVGLATPETEAACLETVRGRTVRAVEALLRAVGAASGEDAWTEDRVLVRVACSPRVTAKWAAALELARRMAGEELAAGECAEAVAAECLSTLRGGATEAGAAGAGVGDTLACAAEIGTEPVGGPRPAADGAALESGLRAEVWPRLSWRARRARKLDRLERLGRGLEACSANALDGRFRILMARLQALDFEIGRVLRQVLDRGLYRKLGFESFERFVSERLDFSPRTARRLVRMARAEQGVPEVASAFRAGRITLLQAEVLLRGGTVSRAVRVTLRRLRDEVPVRGVVFWAPRSVARLFLGLVGRMGLEAMLDCAIATWLQAGRAFRDYADFERDGWRCTVPGCSARRNLQSHHIRFRSAGGPDVAWNRTTLCAFHHLRGVHGGTLGIRGRAPDELVYTLGVGRYRSGDVLA